MISARNLHLCAFPAHLYNIYSSVYILPTCLSVSVFAVLLSERKIPFLWYGNVTSLNIVEYEGRQVCALGGREQDLEKVHSMTGSQSASHEDRVKIKIRILNQSPSNLIDISVF